jgi:hypothetical protein
MGEVESAHLRALGFDVGLDEPFQHFQFAGRADLVAWSVERCALMHIENRTRFPNIQDAFGSYNAKRAYLGSELARRLGLPQWRSETHVMAALWSSEATHQIRLHSSSFRSVCPDPAEAFCGWWNGNPPPTGRSSALVLFDPAAPGHGGKFRLAALELDHVRPRHHDYAAALAALRTRRRA